MWQALSVVLLLLAVVAVVGTTAILAASALSGIDRPARVARDRREVARYIEGVLRGSGGEWDWDDFLSAPLVDPELEAIRARCAALPADFPPADEGDYCGPEGVSLLEQYLRDLRLAEAWAPTPSAVAGRDDVVH